MTGSDLKQLRRGRGLSQDAVAQDAAVDRSTLSRIERGFQIPRPETVLRIVQAIIRDENEARS